MKENKVELTDEEQEIKNLINFFLKKEDNYELNGLKTTYKYLQNKYNETNWWHDGVIYDQKAHAIMHILAANSETELSKIIKNIKNSGLQLWIYLAIKDATKKSVDVIEKYFENLNNIKDFDHNKEKKISNNLFSLIEEIEKDKKYSSVSFNNKDVNTLLKYVELYFSEPSNYNKLDYLNFNEPILNNLYNWYYNELKKPDQINTYCNKLENIINSMEQLLTREKNTTIQKCNIICTIAKTKIIINKLIN